MGVSAKGDSAEVPGAADSVLADGITGSGVCEPDCILTELHAVNSVTITSKYAHRTIIFLIFCSLLRVNSCGVFSRITDAVQFSESGLNSEGL
jgi:hypothetical protein